MNSAKPKRIGIYAGTFDPVHVGHVAFALQSSEAANLDMVYFLPERQPRLKQNVEHFGHRTAMLDKAIKPHKKFAVLELVDQSFSVARTLPKLNKQFQDSQLVFLFGSDVLTKIAQWPNAGQLLQYAELVIGLRNQDDRQAAHKIIESWPVQPIAVTMFPSYAPEVSSKQVREALGKGKSVPGTLTSVERYSNRNWLYVTLDSH